MMKDHHVRLIHRVLDAEATADERRAFEALRAENAEARRLYEDLEATTHLLAQAEPATPPATLKARVMRALPEVRYAPHRQQQKRSIGSTFAVLWDALRDALGARPAIGYAYAAALGILAGAGGYALLPGLVDPSPSAVVGRMAPAAETFAVDADGVEGTVRVTTGGERLRVQLNLQSQQAGRTGARLTFDPETLWWRSLRRLEGGADAALSIRREAILLAASGALRYEVTFNERSPGGTPASLVLALTQDGRTIYRQPLLPAIDANE